MGPGGWPDAGTTDPSTNIPSTSGPPVTSTTRSTRSSWPWPITKRCSATHPLVEASPVDPETGKLLPVVTIVTDNGGPFWSFRFESFITTHPELVHVRTRVKTPGQNGSRERGFGTLKYERLYLDEIDDALAPSGPRPTGSSTTNSGLMRPSHGTGPKRCIRDWPPRTPQHSKPKKPCQLLEAGHSV